MNKTKERLKPDLLVNIDLGNVFSAKQSANWTECRVVDVLSEQFTALAPSFRTDGEYKIVFRAYTDRGRSWDFIDG